MEKAIVVTTSLNRVIGKDGKIPWDLPDNLKYIDKLTYRSSVIMGRKTYETMDKPFENRRNIVLSRNPDYLKLPSICWLYPGIEEALKLELYGMIFFIGGQQIYEAALPLVDTVHMTLVLDYFEGDTFFPPLTPGEWEEMPRKFHNKDTQHAYPFQALTFVRKNRQK